MLSNEERSIKTQIAAHTRHGNSAHVKKLRTELVAIKALRLREEADAIEAELFNPEFGNTDVTRDG